jgi:hypothetical protein
LLPYIYSMARKAHDESLPLCRPLYYHWPEEEEAYRRPGEYMFGDDLLVAPVTKAADASSGCAAMEVWFPPGEWVNWFTGRSYQGPATTWLLIPLNEIPLFARAGAVIPAQPYARRSDARPLDSLVLHVWPGESGATTLYEDDGVSEGYRDGQFARTQIRNSVRDGERIVYIPARKGDFAAAPESRSYEIILHDIAPPRGVLVNGEALSQVSPPGAGWHYDGRQLAAVVRVPATPVSGAVEVRVQHAASTDLDGWLAGGLRGLYRTLASAADVREADIPVEVMNRLPGRAGDSSFGALKNARQVVEQWDEATRLLAAPVEAGSGGNEREARERVRIRRALRMLGLAVDFNLENAAEGVRGILTVVATHALPGMRGLGGRVRLTLDGADQPVLDREFKGLMPGTALREAVSIPPVDGNRVMSLRGTVTVDVDGSPIGVPFERVLLPSVNCWWVIGPFEAPFDSGLATVLPPEEPAFDSRARFEGKDGAEVAWQRAVREVRPGDDLSGEFFVHLHDFFGRRITNAVAYGFAYLHAPADMDASLAIGSDDGVAVWLNGVEVHRQKIGRAYGPKQDRVPVKLKAGVNTLLLKVNQGGGDWGFSAFVETPDGQPLPDVIASLEPTPP